MAVLEDFLLPAASTAVGAGVGALVGNPLLGASLGMTAGGMISNVIAGDELQNAMRNASAEEQERIAAAIQKLEQGWKNPELDTAAITPEELVLLQKYTPKIAQFTQESAPHLLRGIGQQESISAQQQALRQLQAQSVVGGDEISRAQQAAATTQAQQALAGERANILREMAARGTLGGGQEVLAQMAAAGQAEQMARQEGLSAAAQEAQRRQEALRQMASLAGNMRGQAAQQEQTNVDILNSFNQRATMRKQAYDQYKAAQENDAQLRNLSESQRVYEANKQAAYQAAIRNQALKNQAASQRAQSANELLQATTGLTTGASRSAAASDVAAAQARAGQQAAIGGGLAQAGTTMLGSALGSKKVGAGKTESTLPPTDEYVPEEGVPTDWTGKSKGFKPQV